MELTAISAICEDICDIYSLDLKTEAVTAIRQSGHALNVGGPGMENSRYEEVMRSYISNNVLIRDRDQFLHTVRLQNILDAIEKEGSLSVFYRVYRNGELQYFRLKCVPVRENGDITKLVFAFIPESFRTRQSELIRLIEMDDVTNLYNKQAFYQHASELLAEDPGGDYDVIITDVVGFKLVNQVYGRSGGDSVLKYLAERFEAAARGGVSAPGTARTGLSFCRKPCPTGRRRCSDCWRKSSLQSRRCRICPSTTASTERSAGITLWRRCVIRRCWL